MRRVAVIGVGVTKFGKHDRTSAELFAEAASEAILDSGVAPSAIQALYFGNVTGGETERQLHMAPLAATLLGLPTIPTSRFENACATSHVAFRHAVMEIASGVADVVLVGGAERVLNVPTESATEFFAYCSDASIEQPAGEMTIDIGEASAAELPVGELEPPMPVQRPETLKQNESQRVAPKRRVVKRAKPAEPKPEPDFLTRLFGGGQSEPPARPKTP